MSPLLRLGCSLLTSGWTLCDLLRDGRGGGGGCRDKADDTWEEVLGVRQVGGGVTEKPGDDTDDTGGGVRGKSGGKMC